MASVSRASRSRKPAAPVHTSIAPPSFRAALLFGAGVLAAYILTLEPSVAGGDSGELIAAAKTMSAGHPPGYPLYLLLTRVFLFLPFQSIAWRASLASAFCGAAAAAALFWFIKEETRSSWAAFAGAGLFAFSRVVWQYATEADVFALNDLFAAVLLCFASRMERKFEPRLAVLAAGWVGLGLGNHHTLILFALPVAAWFAWTRRRELADARLLALSAIAFAAGLLVYLYLPLSRVSIFGWGDLHTAKGFFAHLLRSDYGTLRLGASDRSSPAWEVAASFAGEMARAAAWVGVAPMALGAARSTGRGYLWAALAAYLAVFFTSAKLPLYMQVHASQLLRIYTPH